MMYPDINSSNPIGDKNNSDKVTLNDVFVHADTEHTHVDDQHIIKETNDKQVTN